MSENQIKTINEIILHKDEPLARHLLHTILEGKISGVPLNRAIKAILESKESFENLKIQADESIEEALLNVDKIAIDLSPYDKSVLHDIQKGHWDIYRSRLDETENTLKIPLKKKLNARSALLDIKKEGVVAIDFGTKATVVGFVDEKSQKRLIRIGSGNIKANHEKNDYENPTIMEFININDFFKAYHSPKSRPLTRWEDLRVSHTAEANLFEAKEDDFYCFFSSLKQWANMDSSNTLRIRDTKDILSLKDFKHCDDKDFNPIEIYAYYIARYINNMNNGIYLSYLLSFPVKYPKNVRDKIRQSFENGIKKALPNAVLTSKYAKDLKVELSASEPAAYAVSALEEYGFYDEKYADEELHYGVFDFGGGTTDFDFGIWRGSEKSRYDFDIEHFGAGGLSKLGGEYLLELLAFEVFKDNKELMRSHNCSFIKPEKAKDFGGSEGLISTSQEARKNTALLVKELRVFWENIHLFREETQLEDESLASKISALKRGELELLLVSNDGKTHTLGLSIDLEKLENVLVSRIEEGVDSFYHSFKNAAKKMQGLDTLHIFLGGNASRSILVKEAFERMIAKENELSGGALEFELYPPLGTIEAEEKRKELGLKANTDEDLSTKITCKTGVVFGLLECRKGSKINVISEITEEDEAKFNFYLGIAKMRKFHIIIDRDNIDTTSHDYEEFLDYADEEVELYYTSNASAVSNNLTREEVKRVILKLDKKYENGKIYIKITGANSLKYAVFENGTRAYEGEEIELRD